MSLMVTRDFARFTREFYSFTREFNRFTREFSCFTRDSKKMPICQGIVCMTIRWHIGHL
ncbi:hypothetical protein RCO48_33815 [Peribacillus frigoritolerans]|nr:hypothetical protein [Peribacillus frigoritolerans]